MLNELEALVILSGIPQVGTVKARMLIKHFGSALEVLEGDPSLISSLPGVGHRVIANWGKWKTDTTWKRNFELAEKHQVEIIPYTHPKYPKRLLEIHDHPALLYIKGQFLPSDQRSIAVVGTRKPSIYGRDMAEKFAQELASAGFTVVSGLARGIDTAAHLGALQRGRTIAVIGSGLANIYPQENKELAEAIAQKGVVISEFPMETPPDRLNFPQRNRIVSGMTMGSLLVEAPIKSGAMITMEKAFEYKRKLFALPGRADTEDFRGNHLLIKEWGAKLVENGNDIINSFGDLFGGLGNQQKIAKTPNIFLEPEEEKFLNTLPNQELSIDEIMQLTKLPVIKVTVLLMGLVLKKAIREFPGKIYKKAIQG